MKKSEAIDERIRALVDEGLIEAMPDEESRRPIVDAVMAKLEPAYGAIAQRRRMTSDLRAAFKDGFLLGRTFGKFGRWHTEIWNRSNTAMQLRAVANDTGKVRERFARYNFDD